VMKGLQDMRNEAETPALLKRIYNRAWGQFDSVFDLDPDEKERIRLLATGVLGEATQKAADKLLDPKVAEAFRTLQLKPWAKLQEVQERYLFLMKQRHPDRPGGDKDLAAKLNDARDVLEIYHHKLS
jgi:DnaJ-domain-containing protein 1